MSCSLRRSRLGAVEGGVRLDSKECRVRDGKHKWQPRKVE